MSSDAVTESNALTTDWNTFDDNQDDWGDYASVISELATEDEPEAVNTPETKTEQGEAMASFVDVALVVIEQVTSVISGFEFKFDETGKQKVLEAAVPVLNKHGNKALALFGGYIEEATLLVAVLALVFSAKKTIQLKKQEALANGEETKAVAVS